MVAAKRDLMMMTMIAAWIEKLKKIKGGLFARIGSGERRDVLAQGML